MGEGEKLLERRFSREDLLKLAAAAGGAGLLAGRAGAANAALARLAKESGQLQVLDWAGYEVKPLWATYQKKYPGEKPKVTFMTNEANAFAKLRAGFKPDVFRPYVGYVRDFAESGFTQPWDPKLITNLKYLNPMPADIEEVLRRYRKVVLPEMNLGQLALLLRGMFLVDVIAVNQVRGLPFRVDDLVAAVRSVLDGSYLRTAIGSAGRLGTPPAVPTIEVGTDPLDDPENLLPATNGASR